MPRAVDITDCLYDQEDDEPVLSPAERGALLAEGMLCPFCNSQVEFCSADRVYGVKYAHLNLYVCSRFPDCDSYVGSHEGTGLPKGTLADKALREARKLAHAAFDPLWREGETEIFSRHEAYEWLARQLGIGKNETHIGMFDVQTCEKVVKVVTQLRMVMQSRNE